MPNFPHTSKSKPKGTSSSLDVSTGTKMLADAMTSFLSAPTKRASKPGKSYLRAAAGSLMQVVPKENLLAMLHQLTVDVEDMTEKEFGKSSWARLKPGAPERLGTTVQAASSPAMVVSTDEFMADLRRQEKELRLADIAAKRLIPGSEMQERLGVTSQALSAALKAKRMFIMQGPAGEYLYPAFFADPKYDRRVLEKACKTLGDIPAGSKWEFFMTKRLSLGRKTPLDALLSGKLESVMAAAAGFAEM